MVLVISPFQASSSILVRMMLLISLLQAPCGQSAVIRKLMLSNLLTPRRVVSGTTRSRMAAWATGGFATSFGRQSYYVGPHRLGFEPYGTTIGPDYPAPRLHALKSTRFGRGKGSDFAFSSSTEDAQPQCFRHFETQNTTMSGSTTS